jgi:hypothetical protein
MYYPIYRKETYIYETTNRKTKHQSNKVIDSWSMSQCKKAQER